jgi:hypothetical protein
MLRSPKPPVPTPVLLHSLALPAGVGPFRALQLIRKHKSIEESLKNIDTEKHKYDLRLSLAVTSCSRLFVPFLLLSACLHHEHAIQVAVR